MSTLLSLRLLSSHSRRVPWPVGQPGHAAFGIDELRAFLADKLAKYEMPTEMEIAQACSDARWEIVKKVLLAEEIVKRQAADALSVSSKVA
jgi:hypothetical protein